MPLQPESKIIGTFYIQKFSVDSITPQHMLAEIEFITEYNTNKPFLDSKVKDCYSTSNKYCNKKGKEKLDIVEILVIVLALYCINWRMEHWIGPLPSEERLEAVGGGNYLFCMGLEVDGGILRKDESTCL